MHASHLSEISVISFFFYDFDTCIITYQEREREKEREIWVGKIIATFLAGKVQN